MPRPLVNTDGVILATQTLALIDEAIGKDGGAKFRQNLEVLIPKMEDAYRGESSPYRKHLGASLIGRDCARELWYSFRWAMRKKVSPRIQRLFNRGHLEEARFLALLQLLDTVNLWYETEDGGQFRFSHFNGHFGSALDGVVIGIPELPEKTPAYTEFKTMSDKQFQKLKKLGMREAKPEHFAQCQVCMLKMELPYCLYMVVNKNDDHLYAEIIEFDATVAQRYLERAEMVIFSTEPPPQINPSISWYQCAYCDFLPVCKKYDIADINCRTCAHSEPLEDGTWGCSRGRLEIFDKRAYTGCPEHVFNPHLLQKTKFLGGDGKNAYLELPTGERITQGPDGETSEQFKHRNLLK